MTVTPLQPHSFMPDAQKIGEKSPIGDEFLVLLEDRAQVDEREHQKSPDAIQPIIREKKIPIDLGMSSVAEFGKEVSFEMALSKHVPEETKDDLAGVIGLQASEVALDPKKSIGAISDIAGDNGEVDADLSALIPESLEELDLDQQSSSSNGVAASSAPINQTLTASTEKLDTPNKSSLNEQSVTEGKASNSDPLPPTSNISIQHPEEAPAIAANISDQGTKAQIDLSATAQTMATDSSASTVKTDKIIQSVSEQITPGETDPETEAGSFNQSNGFGDKSSSEGQSAQKADTVTIAPRVAFNQAESPTIVANQAAPTAEQAKPVVTLAESGRVIGQEGHTLNEAVVRPVVAAVRFGQKEVNVRLNPPELGEVHVKLSLATEQQGMRVVVRLDNEQAYQHFVKNADGFRTVISQFGEVDSQEITLRSNADQNEGSKGFSNDNRRDDEQNSTSQSKSPELDRRIQEIDVVIEQHNTGNLMVLPGCSILV